MESDFFTVKGLSYPQRITLQASDLIESYQYDPRNSETRFWPGTKAVRHYLAQNIPEGAELLEEDSKPDGKAFKMPAHIRHEAKMGTDIPD